MKSRRYQDYVIKDGKFIGAFEDMYNNSEEIPWHQDRTAFEVFSNIDLAVLSFFTKHYNLHSLCEVGCGYGYVTNRIKEEIPEIDVAGIDISAKAIQEATTKFPDIPFKTADLLQPYSFDDKYDVVMVKEVLWYVLENLNCFFDNITQLSRRMVYIVQSFPETETFLGQDIFPDAKALIEYINLRFEVIHTSVEKDSRYNNRELVHILAKKREYDAN